MKRFAIFYALLLVPILGLTADAQTVLNPNCQCGPTIAYTTLQVNGVQSPQERVLDLISSGAAFNDDPTNQRTQVYLTGGGGGDGGAGGGSTPPIRFGVTNSASQASVTAIQSGYLVGRVRFQVTTAFSVGATIEIGSSSAPSSILATGVIDASLGSVGFVYDMPIDVIWPSTGTLQVAIGGLPGSGAGTLTVYYAPTPTD